MTNGITNIGTFAEQEKANKYIIHSWVTSDQILPSSEKYSQPTNFATMEKEIEQEFSDIYVSQPVTGETKMLHSPLIEEIIEILDKSIQLIDEVLEVYDDELERINTFSLFEEKIKALWKLRDEENQNFAGVLILLEVATKNSHYENYKKNQYKAIRIVLQEIKEVQTSHEQLRKCRKILKDSGIDVHAPIRNWDKFTIEIKKISEE